jgi:hypothetical protein
MIRGPALPLEHPWQRLLQSEIRVALISFEEEAENCRRKALAYVGQPEAPFLLSVARQFDRLAHEMANNDGRAGAVVGDRPTFTNLAQDPS